MGCTLSTPPVAHDDDDSLDGVVAPLNLDLQSAPPSSRAETPRSVAGTPRVVRSQSATSSSKSTVVIYVRPRADDNTDDGTPEAAAESTNDELTVRRASTGIRFGESAQEYASRQQHQQQQQRGRSTPSSASQPPSRQGSALFAMLTAPSTPMSTDTLPEAAAATTVRRLRLVRQNTVTSNDPRDGAEAEAAFAWSPLVADLNPDMVA